MNFGSGKWVRTKYEFLDNVPSTYFVFEEFYLKNVVTILTFHHHFFFTLPCDTYFAPLSILRLFSHIATFDFVWFWNASFY